MGTPAFSVALEWQSPNWGSTESSRVRVAPGPSHVLPTKTRSTSQPPTPHPQRPALSVNGTAAADWSACGESCLPSGCVPVVLTFLASRLWECLRFHNNPLHSPTRGQHLRSPASKKHPDSPSGFGWDVKRVSDCLKPIWRISILLPPCLVQMEGDLSLLMDVAVKFSPLLV